MNMDVNLFYLWKSDLIKIIKNLFSICFSLLVLVYRTVQILGSIILDLSFAFGFKRRELVVYDDPKTEGAVREGIFISYI